MNLLVSGGTNKNKDVFIEMISSISSEEEISSIVLSKASNDFAIQYANENGIELKIINPDFDLNGKSSSYICNSEKIEKSDALLLIWDGKTKNNKDLLNKSIKSQLQVFRNV